jgi:hypothetical protein
LITVKEFQAAYTFGYPDIMLVEDGCPLHRGPMQALACPAVAYCCVYRVCAHFHPNRITVAAGPVFDDKPGIRDRRIFRSEIFFHNCNSLHNIFMQKFRLDNDINIANLLFKPLNPA